MKTLKMGIILLAFLLAAMVIMPIVSAENAQITVSNPTLDPAKDPEIAAILKNVSSLETLPTSVRAAAAQNGIRSPSPDAVKAMETYLDTYVPPSTQIINLMKTKDYSNSQITDFLSKNGYGWDPKTGGNWKGRAPTADEQKIIDQIRGPNYNPFPKTNGSLVKPLTLTSSSLREGGSGIWLNPTNTYFGINWDMIPGPMAESSTGTVQQVVTTHVGKGSPSGAEWTEAGVAKFLNGVPQYFTYDGDQGTWMFPSLTTSPSSLNNYEIYVSNSKDASGYYIYYTFINNQFVRTGHLYYRQTQFNMVTEVWANGNYPFTSDNGVYFEYPYLFDSTGLQDWGNYPATSTSESSNKPPYDSYWMNGGSWEVNCWV
jgi:hypothetical protein